MLIKLNEIARRLNGSLSGRCINVRGPGHGAGDRSLGIFFDPKAPDGFRVHSFAGDEQDECRAHVKSLIQNVNGDFCDLYEPEHAHNEAAPARKQQAMGLWQKAISSPGTPVVPYLKSRALKGVASDDAIRFHAACPFEAFRVPAMVALITEAVTGEPNGIHRTAIKDDGSGKRFGPDFKEDVGRRAQWRGTASCRFRTSRHCRRHRDGPERHAGVQDARLGHVVERGHRKFPHSPRHQTTDGVCRSRPAWHRCR